MDSNKKELKERVEAKRKRVEARVHELKADAAKGGREQAEKLQKELAEIKSTVAGGYEHLKDESVAKLNAWLSK